MEKFHPETDHFGKCVWISEDGKTAAILCERSHEGKKLPSWLRSILRNELLERARE